MTPVQHPAKAPRVLHVALQSRQKNVTRVGKDDDSKGNWKSFKVQRENDFRKSPLADASEAISDHDEVYDDVGHCTPEGERGD